MDAKTFKSERKKVGLTLTEIGSAMGISKQSVSHWERGTKPIPLARQTQAREIFANPDKYRQGKKVYLVWCNEDNLLDYEDNKDIDYILGVFSTREKARAFIDSWVPHLSEGQRIVEDPSEIKTEGGLDVSYDTHADRIIYIHHELKWKRALCMLTIDEREVDN